MPLVTRQANQGVIFRQPLEPGESLDGDLWSDTTANLLKLNNSGTFQDVGQTSFSASATVSFSETIGDYVQPDSAVATSAAAVTADSLWGTADDQVIENFSTYADQSAATTKYPTSSGTFVASNVITDVIDWTSDTGALQNNALVRDIGLISETAWTFRCKLIIDAIAIGAAGVSRIAWGFSDLDETANFTTNQDFIGFSITVTNSVNLTRNIWANNQGLTTNEDEMGFTAEASTLHLEIIRELAGTFTVNLFSDSSFTTLLATEQTTGVTATALRFFKVTTQDSASSSTDLNGTITDMQFWDGNTSVGLVASNAVDDNTSTLWESVAEANPAIFVSEGENNNYVGCALFWNSNTTETSFTIRVSTDTTFTSAEDVRTILSSAMTAGAFNFIRFNVKNGRHMQIRGASGSSLVLAINEIKSLVKTDSEILQDLGVIEISPTDTSLALDGT